MEQINPQVYADVEPVLSAPIDQLKSFCRGEMSAVETYQRAMEVVKQGWVMEELRDNLASHEERVRLLKNRILQLGGDPPESSGSWGAFAKALEDIAAVIGENAALAILEEGERHGLADYQADVSQLDYDSLRMMNERIIPQQSRTHRSLHEIVRALTA
jgi:demethoxyubiquinone hydroxylase (CLK1/Coq7/Cat5 family)